MVLASVSEMTDDPERAAANVLLDAVMITDPDHRAEGETFEQTDDLARLAFQRLIESGAVVVSDDGEDLTVSIAPLLTAACSIIMSLTKLVALNLGADHAEVIGTLREHVNRELFPPDSL